MGVDATVVSTVMLHDAPADVRRDQQGGDPRTKPVELESCISSIRSFGRENKVVRPRDTSLGRRVMVTVSLMCRRNSN
jgi:hypothetical protein